MHGGGGFAVEGGRLFGGRHPLVPDSMMTAAQLDRIKRATEPAARLEITQDCPEMAFENSLEIALEIAPRSPRGDDQPRDRPRDAPRSLDAAAATEWRRVQPASLEQALKQLRRRRAPQGERSLRGCPSAGALPASCTCRSPAPTMGG